MRKNGFKKDLPALIPRDFFHVIMRLFSKPYRVWVGAWVGGVGRWVVE